jgi:hypothetical protein
MPSSKLYLLHLPSVNFDTDNFFNVGCVEYVGEGAFRLREVVMPRVMA